MIYDLTNALHRKQFVARANKLLKNHCKVVELTDSSPRSLKQNSYLHVLVRILAMETGVEEWYAKNVYFKSFANPQLFERKVTDPITKKPSVSLRSTKDLSVDEMALAINRFRKWSEEQGYYLPEAHQNDDGTLTFASDEDREAYEKAMAETSRLDAYL